jgi:hypothetical protein
MADEKDYKEMLLRAMKVLIQLYSDKTHLVYELLQNAEDCQAQSIHFFMYPDRLELYHDGKPFTQSNLVSITNVAFSDKKINDIGKFGIGFKSVFSICKDVELYNEPERYKTKEKNNSNFLHRFAYRIVDFFELKEIDFNESLGGFTTRFVFPFCVDEEFNGFEKIEDLSDELSSRICSLGADVLLFLKNNKKIEYTIYAEDEESIRHGWYTLSKKELSNNCYEIKATEKDDNGSPVDSLFLMYSCPEKETNKSIDLVFAVKQWIDNKPVFVQPHEKHRFISVYFPTGEESKLKFIIQAPFATTPNRGEVPVNEENRKLIQRAAELLKEAVLDIRKRGWLSLDLLNLLPFSMPNDDWLFTPLYEMTKKLFENEKVYPVIDGGYADKDKVRIARGGVSEGGIVDIFTNQKLGLLIGEGIKWMPTKTNNGNFTEDRNSYFRDLYQFIRDKIKVPEIRNENIPGLIRNNSNFMPSINDDIWLKEFYNYLADKLKNLLGKNHDYSTVEFIKNQQGNFVSAYKRIGNEQVPNVYKKPNGISEIGEQNSEIIADFIQEKCANFVEAMDIAEYDDYAYFTKTLEVNRDRIPTDNPIAIKHRFLLVQKAIQFLRADKSGIIDICKRCLFLKVINPDGISRDRKCVNSNIYREKDTNGVSLKNYFSGINHLGVHDVYTLDEKYYLENGLAADDFKALEKIGVKNNIYNGINNAQWTIGRNICTNIGNFRKKLNFEYIEDVLGCLSKQKSGIIFSLLKNVKPQLSGKWQYGATHPKEKPGFAEIIEILSNNCWLFTNDGGRPVKANNILRSELDVNIYGEVDKYSELYDILGFRKDPVETLLLKFRSAFSHFSENEIQKLVSHFEKDAENNIFDPDKNAKAFPEEPVKDLGRLKSATKKNYDNAPSVKYEIIPRSIRISRINPRDNLERYKGYCQMCKTQGLYWEIAEVFLEPKKEIKQMNLSLCPTCAAKYKLLRNDKYLMAKFRDNILNADINEAQKNRSGTLVVDLGDTHICFTATHLAEIQELLRYMEH